MTLRRQVCPRFETEAAGEKRLPRYRYRTTVLAGPWRDSQDEALADAVRAHQLRIEGDSRQWLVPGEIEESAETKSRQRG